VSYFTGALGASFGIAQFVLDDLKPETIAFVITDDAAGRGGFSLIQPIMSRDGATVNPVFVQPTATAPEIESAMLAVQADTADVVVIGMFEQGCIASYDAMKNLGIDATKTSVVAVAPCHGAAMQAHMAEVGESGILPNGWYFTGQGYNIFTGNAEAGTDTVIDILDQAGKSEAIYTVGSEEMISGFMTVMKHLNALDGDFAIDKVNSAIRDFTGPVMSAAGPMKCGGAATFTGICGMRTSIERYIDGEWEATRAGDNAVDFSALMGFSA
jgi:ABC-type branched-subunit amino acid transport system substrate-binding protein